MLDLADLMESTRRLQKEAFGIDPSELTGEAFSDYIRTNVLAAQVELSEFIQEIPWKPWKESYGRPNHIARERAVMELIDVLHFWLNLAAALRVDGAELSTVYLAKRQTNVERRESLNGNRA